MNTEKEFFYQELTGEIINFARARPKLEYKRLKEIKEDKFDYYSIVMTKRRIKK